MVNDTLSDVLTRIRNGCLNNSQVVSIPLTRLSQQVCYTLEKEGFIESFHRDPSLNDILIIKLKYKDVTLAMPQRGKKAHAVPLLAPSGHRKKAQEGFKKDLKINSSIKNSQTLNQKRPCITNLKRISKPGLRIYVRHKQIPTVLGGLGILILSTPKGIMTDREARYRKVGGEILCSVW